MKTTRPEKVKASLEHIYDLISDAELDSAKRDIEHVLSELIALAGSRPLRQELTPFLANAPNINL